MVELPHIACPDIPLATGFYLSKSSACSARTGRPAACKHRRHWQPGCPRRQTVPFNLIGTGLQRPADQLDHLLPGAVIDARVVDTDLAEAGIEKRMTVSALNGLG